MSDLYTESLVERIGQLVTGRASSDTTLFPVAEEEKPAKAEVEKDGEEVPASPLD